MFSDLGTTFYDSTRTVFRLVPEIFRLAVCDSDPTPERNAGQRSTKQNRGISDLVGTRSALPDRLVWKLKGGKMPVLFAFAS